MRTRVSFVVGAVASCGGDDDAPSDAANSMDAARNDASAALDATTNDSATSADAAPNDAASDALEADGALDQADPVGVGGRRGADERDEEGQREDGDERSAHGGSPENWRGIAGSWI